MLANGCDAGEVYALAVVNQVKYVHYGPLLQCHGKVEYMKILYN